MRKPGEKQVMPVSSHGGRPEWRYRIMRYLVRVLSYSDGIAVEVTDANTGEELYDEYCFWVRWRALSPFQQESLLMSFLRKATGRSSNGDCIASASDPTFQKSTPALFEYLTASQYDDGEARTTATLTIFVEDGLFKAAVNDRDSRRSCFFTAGTFQDVLRSVEKGLAGGNCDWRNWREERGKKKI